MSEVSKERVEILAAVLSAVHRSALSIITKTDSLLRDYYAYGITCFDRDLDTLMEIRSSTRALAFYLEDLLEQTREASVNSVFLPPAEVKMMATLISAVGLANGAKIGNGNLWSH